MSACAIANSVDRRHYDEREKKYMDRIGKYEKKEVDLFPQLLAITTAALDADPEQDFLGSLFQELDLSNHWQGQFFTPYSVSRMMAELQTGDITKLVERKGYVTVNDCACGAGALLIAFAHAAKGQGVNYQQKVLFVGQDVDMTAAAMCYIQLSLLGCAGYVIVANTISEPIVPPDSPQVWYTPMYFSEHWVWRRRLERMRELVALAPDDPTPPKVEAEKSKPKPMPRKRKRGTGAEKPHQLTLF